MEVDWRKARRKIVKQDALEETSTRYSTDKFNSGHLQACNY